MDPSMPDSRGAATSTRLWLAFWVMLVLSVLNCATLVAQVPSASPASIDTIVTDAERRGLQFDAETIRNTALGFVLPRPGPGLIVNPQLQRQLEEGLAGNPEMAGWALTDSVQRQSVVIQVTKLARLDEGAFRRFTHGIREGFSRAKLVDEVLSWNPGTSEYRLIMLHPRGFYITMRCIPRVEPGRFLIACVQTTTSRQDDLESIRAGLRFIQ